MANINIDEQIKQLEQHAANASALAREWHDRHQQLLGQLEMLANMKRSNISIVAPDAAEHVETPATATDAAA